MKSKFFILLISALLLHKIAFGQDDEVDDSDDSYYLAQFSISSFFERYNSVDVGMLKSINNRGLGFHLGYIYDINSFYEENESNWFKNVNGLKLFLQYRFYIEEGSQYPSNS
ncbi:hypothetical protein GCM10011506_05630 [Marivirga lumbricoides]|uniref:DUF2490 domain-containing protein n=1 Tax=Marivirga lumbricoides TaxID=1046115 RepID=A0ABQ1LE42_9BACT|nr:hypothetical protein GCM10011506_05630 [Marivirga lumbricoides]